MRFFWRALALPLVALGIALATVPASAQSFFEKLFGIGPAAPRAAEPPARRASLRGQQHDFDRSERRSRRRDDDDRFAGGKVRTVCVRLCDGYYFPISDGISKSHLARDERKCQASCGAEAVLYHEPAPGGEAEKLVDRGGRPYTELPNAFLYRKTRIDGCACKPEPWSEAALDRHRQYAAVEAARKAELAARMRPVLVASDMTPRRGQKVETALDAPVAPAPSIVVANAPPPGTNTGIVEPTPAQVSEAEAAAGDAAAGASSTQLPAPLFTGELFTLAARSESPVIVSEAQASPAAPLSTPAPDDPIIAPTRAPVELVASAASQPSPSEHRQTEKDQPDGGLDRQAKKSRREDVSAARKPAQRTVAERSRQHQPQRPAKVAAAAPSWFGTKPKYTYPGDAPSRYR